MAVMDYTKHVRAEAFPQLPDSMKSFFEMGGKLLVCAPCLKARGTVEQELIDGAKIIAAATVVAETIGADTTLTY